MKKQIKKYFKNGYKVATKQKDEAQVARIKSVIGLPSDTPEKVILRAEAFDTILKKHPDQANKGFNKALGFVKTLNFPESIKTLPEKQRLNFMSNVASKYLNIVGVKLVPEKGVSYVNTSFITGKKSKYLPEGLATPSSPIGVGAKLPTSGTSNRSITKK
ncbi:hypothetical protein A3F29_00945 [Candidatus Roizmanbacteria bacterium RIFCSPHIGHO2_12_FULL_33_9]|uniref:Uncharacterized protein n=1 Tax=Candidatus Roizmanbacteria bacterium RIFCSPHIGHO2_12_FULL_33_9 TaxID=1802045 RepID=A0A1F7HGI7_9BACT|nr:MAG: hypothetical protein A3F29_00945 [Candidatus Roizmanbacteria bacterium RIFCSPHIGHO2_12_FULL_33_9]